MYAITRKWGEGIIITHCHTGETIAIVDVHEKRKGCVRLRVAAPDHIKIEREEKWAERGRPVKVTPWRDQAQWEELMKQKDKEIEKLKSRLAERIGS